MTTAGDFAAHLRRLRESRGITRYRLAKLAGITSEGVCKLERPGSDPKLSTLLKLAAALRMLPCELIPVEGARTRAKKGRTKRPGETR
jgi:transcriptional regulator with XRE-family HTH domain